MLFNSLAFVGFLPIFLACFFTSHGRFRLLVCLVGSYIFYGWWDVRFLGLILLSTLVDFFVGRKLDATKNESSRKALLAISVASNLGMLAVFKYFNFFLESLVTACAAAGVQLSPPTLQIILPVGISFYTFQTLSYTIDIYRRQLHHESSLLRFAVFVAFFPQLVAGPIVRAQTFLPQLRRDRNLRWETTAAGVAQILTGYVKKCVIADSLAPYVDVVFATPETQTASTVCLGVFFYAFQIYCDFSGYSDIAIGLARVMGFHFPRNFMRPYFATSFSDFWNRWHISLSSWLRDYLYIPLGGNRRGPTRTRINLMSTMLIGGLWHGPAWTFVAWGGLHGSYLILQRLTHVLLPSALRCEENLDRDSWLGTRLIQFSVRLVSGFVVFFLVCVAWVFFRASSFSNAMAIFEHACHFDAFAVGNVQNKMIALKGIALIAGLLFFEALATRIRVIARLVTSPVLFVLFCCSMLWLLAWLGNFSNSAFIYFQF